MPTSRRRRQKQETDTYTIPEAGKRLKIGRNQAYAAAKRGEIPTIKIGRSLRVPKPAFDRLLECPGGTTQFGKTAQAALAGAAWPED